MRGSALPALLFALCLLGCDAGESKDEAKAAPDSAAKAEPNTSKDDAAKAKPEEQAAAKPKKKKEGDSCEWFTAEQIKTGLGLPEGSTVEITPEKIVVRTCSYTWKVPGETKPTSGELDVAVSSSRFADEAAADKAFSDSLAKLAEGMTTGDKVPEFTPIEGVGARASWYPELRQLSVLEGKRFAHLTLRLSDREQNTPDKVLELLKALAATKYSP